MQNKDKPKNMGRLIFFAYFVSKSLYSAQNVLFTTDATNQPLTGICMYFLRLGTKKYLGEETFQVNAIFNESQINLIC